MRTDICLVYVKYNWKISFHKLLTVDFIQFCFTNYESNNQIVWHFDSVLCLRFFLLIEIHRKQNGSFFKVEKVELSINSRRTFWSQDPPDFRKVEKEAHNKKRSQNVLRWAWFAFSWLSMRHAFCRNVLSYSAFS